MQINRYQSLVQQPHRLTGCQHVDGRGDAGAPRRFEYGDRGLAEAELHAAVLRSPHPHARIRSIDLSAAEKHPGVRAALALIDPAGTDDTTKVRYQGEEVAAVAAVSEEAAEDAIRLIKVDYEVLPHLATVEQAMRPEAPLVFPKGNVSQVSERVEGNVEEALGKATIVVEGQYSTQVQTHTSLETHGSVCEWEGDKLTAWVSTQAAHGARDGIAKGLGVAQTNVRVIVEGPPPEV